MEPPEIQKYNDYYWEQDADGSTYKVQVTSLPGKPDMQAHTAEVLRQVEGADVAVGGWTGGDAWFGSVMTSVELFVRLGVSSTFIVKNNNLFFPMATLHEILKARHGDRPAGHWVVMTTTIAAVKVIAIAYAWSQRGVSYFVSTCGSTEPSKMKYESKFEDEWGGTNFQTIDRPEIVHFLYEYLPLIDEHNKQRQSLLALEKRWLTKDCWFRLITTVVGMSVVDMHRCYRYHQLKIKNKKHEEVDLVKIYKFTDLICGGMKQWKYRIERGTTQQKGLERIKGKDGNIDKPPTPKQRLKGKTIGQPYTLNCFVCRKYLDETDNPYYRTTSYWCKDCRMPLCNESRINMDGGREMTCLEEHYNSEDHFFACNDMHNRGTSVPREKLVRLHKKTSRRRKQG